MANLFTTIVTILTIPLVLLNFSSGIVGAGWLFFIYGEWYTPLYAFVVSLVAPFALTFPLMLSMIFIVPGAFLYEKGLFVLIELWKLGLISRRRLKIGSEHPLYIYNDCNSIDILGDFTLALP